MATHLLVENPTAESGTNTERIDPALVLLASARVDAERSPTPSRGGGPRARGLVVPRS